MRGQRLYEGNLEEGLNEVDVTQMQTGLYLVRIAADNYESTEKLIIQQN